MAIYTVEDIGSLLLGGLEDPLLDLAGDVLNRIAMAESFSSFQTTPTSTPISFTLSAGELSNNPEKVLLLVRADYNLRLATDTLLVRLNSPDGEDKVTEENIATDYNQFASQSSFARIVSWSGGDAELVFDASTISGDTLECHNISLVALDLTNLNGSFWSSESPAPHYYVDYNRTYSSVTFNARKNHKYWILYSSNWSMVSGLSHFVQSGIVIPNDDFFTAVSYSFSSQSYDQSKNLLGSYVYESGIDEEITLNLFETGSGVGILNYDFIFVLDLNALNDHIEVQKTSTREIDSEPMTEVFESITPDDQSQYFVLSSYTFQAPEGISLGEAGTGYIFSQNVGGGVIGESITASGYFLGARKTDRTNKYDETCMVMPRVFSTVPRMPQIYELVSFGRGEENFLIRKEASLVFFGATVNHKFSEGLSFSESSEVVGGRILDLSDSASLSGFCDDIFEFAPEILFLEELDLVENSEVLLNWTSEPTNNLVLQDVSEVEFIPLDGWHIQFIESSLENQYTNSDGKVGILELELDSGYSLVFRGSLFGDSSAGGKEVIFSDLGSLEEERVHTPQQTTFGMLSSIAPRLKEDRASIEFSTGSNSPVIVKDPYILSISYDSLGVENIDYWLDQSADIVHLESKETEIASVEIPSDGSTYLILGTCALSWDVSGKSATVALTDESSTLDQEIKWGMSDGTESGFDRHFATCFHVLETTIGDPQAISLVAYSSASGAVDSRMAELVAIRLNKQSNFIFGQDSPDTTFSGGLDFATAAYDLPLSQGGCVLALYFARVSSEVGSYYNAYTLDNFGVPFNLSSLTHAFSRAGEGDDGTNQGTFMRVFARKVDEPVTFSTGLVFESLIGAGFFTVKKYLLLILDARFNLVSEVIEEIISTELIDSGLVERVYVIEDAVGLNLTSSDLYSQTFAAEVDQDVFLINLDTYQVNFEDFAAGLAIEDLTESFVPTDIEDDIVEPLTISDEVETVLRYIIESVDSLTTNNNDETLKIYIDTSDSSLLLDSELTAIQNVESAESQELSFGEKSEVIFTNNNLDRTFPLLIKVKR